MIHYELILLYSAGLTPKDCVKHLGYSRGAAYRFYRIFRDARKRCSAIICDRYSVSPGREKKANKLGVGAAKRRVSRREKRPVLIRKPGTEDEYEKVLL